MNWSKIKNMFIWLFVILDIVLVIFYIYTVRQNKAEVYQEKEVLIKSIKDDNITITEPNIKRDVAGYINAKIDEFKDYVVDDEIRYNIINNGKDAIYLAGEVTKPITNVTKSDFKEEINSFVIKKLQKGVVYVYTKYDREKKEITYSEQIDSLEVFDNQKAKIKFKVTDSGDVKEFEQSALVDIKKDSESKLVTHLQVAYKLYHENKIPKNSKVKSTLGYYTYISQIKNQVLIPTWKIEVEKEKTTKTYYVDAINMKILY